MISFQRILVGVNLSYADRLVSEQVSDHCENAVARAIKLASGCGGTVTFMAILEISEQARHLIEMQEAPDVSPLEVDAHRVLGRLVERAQQAGVQADYALEYGAASDQLVKQLLRGNYTLLIIGHRHSSTLRQFIFGRSTTKLIRKAPTPVLVARHDPVRDIESILVADDFSDIAERVLDAGVQLAKLPSHRLIAVHVLESNNDLKLAASGFPPEAIREIRETQVEEATAKLNERLSRTDARTIEKGVKVHVEHGIPDNVIIKQIEENEVDLLVMGTVGRTGLSALMLGNTAERLLVNVHCSLLVIKPENFVCPVRAD